MKQTIDNLCFNSILINHKITYEKTPLFLFKGQGGNTTALRCPCLPLSAITASLHYLTCQDVCVQESRATKRL